MPNTHVKTVVCNVVPGSFGGAHPECSAISDLLSAAHDLLDAIELSGSRSLSHGEVYRVRELLSAASDITWKPIQAEVTRSLAAVDRALSK